MEFVIVVDDTTDYTKLTTDGWIETDFPVFVAATLDQFSDDFSSTETYEALPIFSLINAQTGEVIYPDCFAYPQPSGSGQGNIAGCIRDHLTL